MKKKAVPAGDDRGHNDGKRPALLAKVVRTLPSLISVVKLAYEALASFLG